MKTKKVALYTVGVILAILTGAYIWVTAGVIPFIISVTVGVLGIGLIIGVDIYYQKRVQRADRKIDQFLEEEKEKENN